jgi:tRNA(Ile)-lysidine synthase
VKTLLERVAVSLCERKLFPREERVLVAVSGGLDSMVLLHVLYELSGKSKSKLCIAHFNHQLRGRASDADERLVQRTAAALGLRFEAGRGAVSKLADQNGISIEMAARELRHNFLAQAARRLKCSVVAVAHHADDQIELFFLRLLRGAGGEGLAGMKWSSSSPADKQIKIIRPLLNVSKDELTRFAKEQRIEFREDASNASRDMLRNRVRHELLPLLRKDFQPALGRTVLRLMEVVGAEAEAVHGAARAWLAKLPRRPAFAKLASGLQRQVIHLQLQRFKIPADFDLTESLRLQPDKPVSITPKQSVLCDKSGQVKRVIPISRAFKSGEQKLNLVRQRASIFFAGLELNWNVVVGAGFVWRDKPVGCEWFDADKIGRNVVLRHWRPGDRFQPIGMKAAVKLQDWFTNLKIPAECRRELVVAVTERGDIFWVEGQRIGERFKLDDDTRKQLHWRWRRA